MEKIALVTQRSEPNLPDGEGLIVAPLKKAGFDVKVVPWDKKGLDWGDFSTVILRTCWDYHERLADFSNWLDQLEESTATIWNPIDIVRKNIDKRYLLDLAQRGVNTIPSVIIKQNSEFQVGDFMISSGWDEVVIKPVAGASGHNVFKGGTGRLDKLQHKANNILQKSDLIVQPFMHQVTQEGEYSIIFFNGKYSHSALKKPKSGDFRTQPHYGGKEAVTNPPEQLVKDAEIAVRAIPSSLLYARVDGLNVDGRLMLMELELTEPYLFFELHPLAPERFVTALKELSI